MIFPFSCKLVIILRLKGVDVCNKMQGEDTTATGPMEQETDNIVSLMISIQKMNKNKKNYHRMQIGWTGWNSGKRFNLNLFLVNLVVVKVKF